MAVYAITCPNCGGGLDILGGRKVVTVTCQYCGSLIDLQDNYKVLAKFNKTSQPDSPFKLGMEGEIMGVKFTIIGLIVYSTRPYNPLDEQWVEYLLYSPTHGYAWLSNEQDNLIFSRTTRNTPTVNLHTLTPKTSFDYNGRAYTFYDAYNAYITFVQGELTYIAKRDDRVRLYEAISPPYGLSCERFGQEIAYTVSQLLDTQEVYKSFNLSEAEIEARYEPAFHPLRPFQAPYLKPLMKVASLFALLSLVVILLLGMTHSGRPIASGSFTASHYESSFEIDDASHLIKLHIQTNLYNNWIDFNIAIKDRNDRVVYAIGKEVAYYSGVEGGEQWHEGAQAVDAYFKVPAPGRYTIQFDTSRQANQVATSFTLYESVIRPYYFVVLLIVSMIASLLYWLSYIHYKRRLWARLEEGYYD